MVRQWRADPRFRNRSIFDATAGPSTIPAVLKRLRITEPTPVLVIIGGAARMPDDIGEQVRALFERSLVPVLESSGMVVMTGGTDSGVMAIAGETLSSVVKLVGVSPRGALVDDPKILIQTNHRLSVLTAGKSWGSETDYMVRLATAITKGARCGVVLLVNGGDVAFEEIKLFVDAGWPILSIAGSGGVADEVNAFAKRRRIGTKKWKSLKMADLDRVDLSGSPREIRKRFHWYISEDELLKSAWTYYLAFDRRANKEQRFNKWIRVALQLGSLIVLSLVLIRFEINLPNKSVPVYLAWTSGNAFIKWLKNVTVPIAVALPIALAAAAAISQTVAADRGWRVLRGAAESLKREIYRYRAWLVVDPGTANSSETGRRDLRVTIDAALRRSASSGFLLSVNLTSRRGRPKGLNEGDDELGLLSVASYTSHRIDGQIGYFQKNGRMLRRRALGVVIVGVLLAAVSGTVANTYYAPWAVVAVLGVTALTAYVERSRLSDRAGRYAAASADLAQIKAGLDIEKTAILSQPQALFATVTRAEAALERESIAWEQLVWKEVRESR
jgi:hypothetical protein